MPSEKILDQLEKQDWPVVIKSATLHAIYQLKYYGLWNRRGIKGYSAEEIAMEAIEKVYMGEWKWNPEKSSLIDYLKFHVIRGLVSNLQKSSEFKSTDDKESTEIYWVTEHNGDDIIDSISRHQIIEFIRRDISADEEVCIVFEELLTGLKRGEICEKYIWEKKNYDNASRRLGGFIRRIEEKIKKTEA